MVLRNEIEDKVRADTLALSAGETLVHAGPLTNCPAGMSSRAVPLDQVPRRLFPASISRASVAGAMLDVTESDPTGVNVAWEA